MTDSGSEPSVQPVREVPRWVVPTLSALMAALFTGLGMLWAFREDAMTTREDARSSAAEMERMVLAAQMTANANSKAIDELRVALTTLTTETTELKVATSNLATELRLNRNALLSAVSAGSDR